MFIYRHLASTQAIDPTKTARIIGAVLAISALVFVSSARNYPLAFALAPVALILGTLLGLALMRSARFWHDDRTGKLWMDGGKAFIAVWAALIVVRIALSIVSGSTASGPHHTQQAGWVAVSSSFLVASMGLWVARGAVIYRKYQADR